MKFDFKELELDEERVSIMINSNKPYSNTKETYIGYISDVTNDFITLDVDFEVTGYPIKKIIIRKNMILSVWVYKDRVYTPPNKK